MSIRPQNNKGRTNTFPITSQKLVTKAQVRAMINGKFKNVQETKWSAVSNNAAVSFSGNLISLCDIAQGDTDTTRDGDELLMTKIEVRFANYLGDTTNITRVIIFRWMPPSVPAVSDFWADIGTAESPLATFIHDQQQNVTVLYDKLCFTGPGRYVEVGQAIQNLNVRVQFVAASTTIATGKVYMFFISDSAAATHPTVSYYARTEFTDS